ncbi:TniQ protein [Burkholderia sp. OK233]|nr:TniQ protein [Burkholderia sp. OK233]
MAIALFPLLDGETIGSNLGRYGDFVGLETTLPLRRRLFGYPCKPDTRLPSGLDQLAEEARDYWNLDAVAIINGHTEFHYATLTLPDMQRRAMRLDMLGQPAGRCFRRSAGGWSGERVTRFRYCEDCLLEWRARSIPAHWMVDHQLPGVYVCSTHSSVLKVTNPASFENLTDPTVMTLRCPTDEKTLNRVSLPEIAAIEDVARRSAQYRMVNDGLTSTETFCELLREARFMWSDGRMDSRAFTACFLEHFGEEYCRLAGLDWQKMTVWLRNIAGQGRGRDFPHPFMFIAAESLLSRRCAMPGSFVPATQSLVLAAQIDSVNGYGDAVERGMRGASCVGILHRRDDTWTACSREGAGWKLACSCGVSYRASGISPSENAQLTEEAYGARYHGLLSMGIVDGVSAGFGSQRFHTLSRFLRWARCAGFSKNKDFSIEAIQRLRDRWCSLVQNARPEKRITSAHQVDPELYRTLTRHDGEWFAAFNLANRTCLKRSLPTAERTKSAHLET